MVVPGGGGHVHGLAPHRSTPHPLPHAPHRLGVPQDGKCLLSFNSQLEAERHVTEALAALGV